LVPSVTAREMQEIDRLAAEEFGIPSLILMENAGRGVAELVWRNDPGSNVVILAGRGNNGGDGLVAARYLHNIGRRVEVLLFADPNHL